MDNNQSKSDDFISRKQNGIRVIWSQSSSCLTCHFYSDCRGPFFLWGPWWFMANPWYGELHVSSRWSILMARTFTTLIISIYTPSIYIQIVFLSSIQRPRVLGPVDQRDSGAGRGKLATLPGCTAISGTTLLPMHASGLPPLGHENSNEMDFFPNNVHSYHDACHSYMYN